jgi:hypothetical protein
MTIDADDADSSLQKEGIHVDYDLLAGPGSVTIYLKHTGELRVRGSLVPNWTEGVSFDDRLLYIRPPAPRWKSVRWSSRQALSALLHKGDGLSAKAYMHA